MLGPMKPFNGIGRDEIDHVMHMMWLGMPLSGYLAGKNRGGYNVSALEDAWAETFKVKHAVAVNSATSGLLAAAFAVGLGPGDTFAVPAMTMSATAAAPMFTGAKPEFVDVEDKTFCNHDFVVGHGVKAAIVTNLFGHAAKVGGLRAAAENFGTWVIEDNSQSPFAMENGRYAGTIGHIGVWSLNVHKHMQCGEGGMVTTDDDELAERLRAFINHGEHVSDRIGLNLRMPEVCAAIARAQLRRAPDIIHGRVEQAQEILHAIGDIPELCPPVVREGCSHVYYTIPFLLGRNRTEFCLSLRTQGVPIVEGYVAPLYRMPAFKPFARPCPVAEDLHDRHLLYIENCAWDFTDNQIKQIGEAFHRAADRCLST